MLEPGNDALMLWWEPDISSGMRKWGEREMNHEKREEAFRRENLHSSLAKHDSRGGETWKYRTQARPFSYIPSVERCQLNEPKRIVLSGEDWKMQ